MQIPLECNTTTSTNMGQRQDYDSSDTSACCVLCLAKFLVSTLGNVRMKSPLGTQAQGTSP